MGKTVVFVLTLRSTGKAYLVHGVGLGEQGSLQRCHLFRHVVLQGVSRARRDAIRPEGNVVRTTALVMVPHDITGLDGQIVGIVLVLGSIEYHVDIVSLSRPGWSVRRGSVRCGGGLLLGSRRRLLIFGLLFAASGR